MSIEADIDEIWDYVDQAEAIDDREARLGALLPLAARARTLCARAATADCFYLLGYVSYVRPDRLTDPKVYDEVEHALQQCLTIDPGYSLATLYLGYNAFDSGQYEVAADRFANVNQSTLDPFIAIKAQEILLCARVRRDGSFAPHHAELDLFVQACGRFETIDIQPLSLDGTVRAILEGTGELDRSTRTLLLQLDQTAQFKWFESLVGPHVPT